MYVHPWEVENLKLQGAKIILNPREEYYPQYDQSIPNSIVLTDQIMENIDSNDLLEAEEI